MGSRREARRIAIDILYQADLTGAVPGEVLQGWLDAGQEVPAFAQELVIGVEVDGPQAALMLEEHAEGWSVARMAALDRTILRVAVHELLRESVPASVAISEAVEAAAELSSDESKGFVNGILGRIARGSAPETDGRTEG